MAMVVHRLNNRLVEFRFNPCKAAASWDAERGGRIVVYVFNSCLYAHDLAIYGWWQCGQTGQLKFMEHVVAQKRRSAVK